jgi:hypothetical protein
LEKTVQDAAPVLTRPGAREKLPIFFKAVLLFLSPKDKKEFVNEKELSSSNVAGSC